MASKVRLDPLAVVQFPFYPLRIAVLAILPYSSYLTFSLAASLPLRILQHLPIVLAQIQANRTLHDQVCRTLRVPRLSVRSTSLRYRERKKEKKITGSKREEFQKKRHPNRSTFFFFGRVCGRLVSKINYLVLALHPSLSSVPDLTDFLAAIFFVATPSPTLQHAVHHYHGASRAFDYRLLPISFLRGYSTNGSFARF